MSAGSLYVAKWNQKTDENGGSADLTWIKLGSATSDEIKALADKLTVKDILEVKSEDPNDTLLHQDPLQRQAELGQGEAGHGEGGRLSRTHRYAAIKGGSMGFTKNEGTTRQRQG